MTTAMIATNSCPVPRSTSAPVNFTTWMIATRQPANAVVMNSPIFSRLTGTPRLREASGAPPAPKIQLPTLVRSSTQVARPASASHQTMEIENCPISEANSPFTTGAASTSMPPSWVRPVTSRVIPMVRPRKMKRLARVTINDGSLVQTTTSPFRNPATSENAIATRIAAHSGQPYSTLSMAITTPLAPIIDPIDRPNLPPMVKNPRLPATSEKNTHTMIAPATAPSSGRLSRRRRSPARRTRSSAWGPAGASVTAMLLLPSWGRSGPSADDPDRLPSGLADALLAEVDHLRGVRLLDERRTGLHDPGRDDTVLLVLGQEHDRQVALQVLLLVDGEQHLAVGDRLQHLG